MIWLALLVAAYFAIKATSRREVSRETYDEWVAQEKAERERERNDRSR